MSGGGQRSTPPPRRHLSARPAWHLGARLRGLGGKAVLHHPRATHRDIDLLVIDPDDATLEGFLRGRLEVTEKGSPHKRAFTMTGLRVELFIVRRQNDEYVTCFWDQLLWKWPSDLLASVAGLPAISESALASYRGNWASIRAYQPDLASTAFRGVEAANCSARWPSLRTSVLSATWSAVPTSGSPRNYGSVTPARQASTSRLATGTHHGRPWDKRGSGSTARVGSNRLWASATSP